MSRNIFSFVNVPSISNASSTLLNTILDPPRFTAVPQAPGLAPQQPTPTPPPQAQPQPTQAPSVPAQVQLFLNAIPIASDGHVITSEYHNSLRNAVLALASHLGVTVQAIEFATATLSPGFLQNDGIAGLSSPLAAAASWTISPGIAAKPSASRSARGWLPVQLPDGKLLQTMTVRGARRHVTRPADVFSVKLYRQALEGTNRTPVPLINVALESAADPFKISQGVAADLAGLGLSSSSALQVTADFRGIDNNTYQYFVTAEVDSPEAGSEIEIYSVQITYGDF